MNADDRLATRVGGIALVVIGAAIVFFVVLLARIEFGSHVRVRVYFKQTGGLREGAPLVVGGRKIGEVEAITLAPRTGGLLAGDDGVIAVVAIDARMVGRVPAAGEVFVASKGPLSERYLEVSPPRVRRDDGSFELAAPGPAVHDGQELRGIDPPSLDRVLQHTWDNLTTASSFLDDVRPSAHELATQLAVLSTNLDALAASRAGTATLALQAAELIATAQHTWDDVVGGRAGLDRIAAVIAQARATSAQARAMLAVLDPRVAALGTGVATARDRLAARTPAAIAAFGDAIDRARAALDKLNPLLAVAQDVADRLARGEGSLGRLMKDPEFPEDAKELGKILKRQPWKIIGHPDDK